MTRAKAVHNSESSISEKAIPNGHMINIMLWELRQAVMLSQLPRVIELLVEHKCPIDRMIIHYAAVTYYNKTIFGFVVSSLAEQRRLLLKLARTHLSQTQLKKLGIQPKQRLLDWQAAATAAELLRSQSIDYGTARFFVPDFAWASSGTSVYFLVGCNQEAAQILYASGFKNVDAIDQLMYSPLSALEMPSLTGYHGQYQVENPTDALSRFLSMCTWFHSRGASLNRVFGLARATPLHLIAGRIGKSLACLLETYGKMQEGEDTRLLDRRFANAWTRALQPLILGSTILQEIFKDIEHHDLFFCPCSLGGTLPLNVPLNEMNNGCHPMKTVRLPRVVGLLIALVVETRGPCSLKAMPDLYEHLTSIVIRACKFACLDIPHTCRSAGLQRFRVMEPKGHAVEDGLNKVVSRFEAKLRESNVPLSQFLSE